MIDPNAQWQIITGDCLEVMKHIPAGMVDCVVTDPPYGVGFKYESHDDTATGYAAWCEKWYAELRKTTSGPVCISCGISNLCEWPQPDWVLCWHKPASMGRCAIGFNNWEPVLVYGKTRAGQVVDVFTAPIVPDKSISGHPCPKPLGWGLGVVSRASKFGDVVLDPFCGSGTTGVAAIQTGRRFIGIELDPKYADIARRRCSEAEPVLFTKAEKSEEAKLWE
jgi:DNA modification methylase